MRKSLLIILMFTLLSSFLIKFEDPEPWKTQLRAEDQTYLKYYPYYFGDYKADAVYYNLDSVTVLLERIKDSFTTVDRDSQETKTQRKFANGQISFIEMVAFSDRHHN